MSDSDERLNGSNPLDKSAWDSLPSDSEAYYEAAHPETPHVARPLKKGPTRMTVAEVADDLRVSKMTVYRMIHSGELKAHRFGRSIRVSYDDYRAYLQAESRA